MVRSFAKKIVANSNWLFVHRLLVLLYFKNLRFAPYDMGRLAFFPFGRVCPRLGDADIDGGVHDAGRRDDGAREENEFRLVKDAVGLWAVVFHPPDPIHRSAWRIKIILKENRNLHRHAQRAENCRDEFGVGARES